MKHVFAFPIPSIRTLVEKRTTMLGANRSTDGEVHLTERLSMTKGEGFLFDDFLQEAVAETYNWIRAFGRGISQAYQIYPDGVLHVIKANHGAHLEVNGEDKGLRHIIPLTSSDYTINYNPQLSEPANRLIGFLVAVNMPAYSGKIGDADEIRGKVTLRYTVGVQDAPIEEKQEISTTFTASEDFDDAATIVPFPVHVDVSNFDMIVKSVESVEIEITEVVKDVTLHKGDYIKLESGPVGMYGILGADYNGGSDMPIIAELLDGDVRNSIVMRVELPDWNDNNMLPAVQNHLQEAIVNYIIWRWFETVNPREANLYHEKWEEKAHKAQLGLNAEKRILQRKSTWL